ncbi:DNA repair protein RecO [Roseimaritima ulvae]|uniref:DNA repair protein RecO n=1 Tax=Roseimaritima ulvae TaxID=980254 RepID=A0A5B9R280_9BACT|nr:DNA repair protein RecO [Roseimaritima ulvae]QEG40341.1 DNA repair protein RecO [Roseimaritima ulvae]
MDKSDAIVLRTIEFSETSLVVTLLTRDFGKLGTLAKGARRPKGPFEGSLDLLALCRVVLIRKAGDTLDLLTEAKLERRFRATELAYLDAHQRLQRLYAGYYVAEMIRHWTDEGDPHPELFDLTLATIQRIDGDAPLAASLLFFELQALRLLGHAPGTQQCVACGGPLPTAGAQTFGLLAGGALCDRCRRQHRETKILSAESFRVLQFLLSPEAIRPETVAEKIYGELRPLLSRYITTMLGYAPRMSRYLPTSVDT